MNKKKQLSKGFVIVASVKPAFYTSALNLIDSILCYYPDANISLFTHKEWVENRAEEMCDKVFDCPKHVRSKMYGMMNSPYDITFYIDADCEIWHEDIVKVWDQLGDNDLCFVRLTKDKKPQSVFAEVYADIEGTNDRIDLQLCGGVCLYNNTKPIVKEFMKDWWEMYIIQEEIAHERRKDPNFDRHDRWWHNGVPQSMLRWDQFTLWWMVNKMDKYKDLKIGEFEDNYRWNWFTSFGDHVEGKYNNLVDKEPIVIHNSSTMNKNKDFRQ